MVKSKSYLIAFYYKEYASAAKNVPRKRQIPILCDLHVRPAIAIEVAAGNKKPYVKLFFCCPEYLPRRSAFGQWQTQSLSLSGQGD